MSSDEVIVVAALFGCVVIASGMLRWSGVMKPDDEVNPGWAYLRLRLIMVGVFALAVAFYFLFTEYVA
ncbi:hypothetical protein [Aeromicrobium sp. Sec7.5]|uniref:hypothetical protein n=1 Tax=Aeromicrobium sp. Sec7.5 TaxID=3121276 RepID=UPI002FE4613F